MQQTDPRAPDLEEDPERVGFLMVLAFSRRMVARIVFDQKIETWLLLHVEAFAELGGAVGTVVPDNQKAAVIRAAFGGDEAASLNRS